MPRERPVVHFVGGLVTGVVAGLLGLTWGPLTWMGAVLFVVLSGIAMPRFAFLAGGLLALGMTWLALMIVLDTPRAFLLVPLVLGGVGVAFSYLTWTRTGRSNGAIRHDR